MQNWPPQLAKMAKPIGLVLFAVVVLIVSSSAYNSIVIEQENVDAAWSEVDNQLKRRADLVPNLVNTVRGFADHEKAIYAQVLTASKKLQAANDRSEQITSANAFSASLARLSRVASLYPDLKSDKSFLRLQDELAGTENRLAVARMRYNDQVREYNTAIRRMPDRFVATLTGHRALGYFEIPEADREVPLVGL